MRKGVPAEVKAAEKIGELMNSLTFNPRYLAAGMNLWPVQVRIRFIQAFVALVDSWAISYNTGAMMDDDDRDFARRASIVSSQIDPFRHEFL